MATKLYVGGLPYSTQEDALKELFAQAGSVVSAVIIMDKMSGRSKGFGFVEMSSQDEASKAISMFNEQEFEGRKLTVNEARPMEARPPRTGGNRRIRRRQRRSPRILIKFLFLQTTLSLASDGVVLFSDVFAGTEFFCYISLIVF